MSKRPSAVTALVPLGATRTVTGTEKQGSGVVAVRIDGDTLAGHALVDAVVPLERRDEAGDPVLVERTDAHAVAPVGMVQRT